jgi:small nuclear ribonucleoprotein (snRNP)-like protein
MVRPITGCGLLLLKTNVYPVRLIFSLPTMPYPQLVELKSGETYNGHMVDCDTFMNVTLRDVYLTSPDGEKFWKLKEVYIRGNVVSVGFYKLIATSPTRAPAGVARDRSSHCYSSTG